MPLTKKQKQELVDKGGKQLQDSKAVIFSEFNKVGVEDFKRLRKELKKSNADLKVLKKRLLNIALKKLGVNFDPMKVKTQIGTIFSKSDLAAIAPIIHKFSKELTRFKKGDFLVLGAYDSLEKRMVDSNEFKALATLPSREVLLAQIAMMLTMPLKQLMKVLEERSKQIQ